MADATPTTKMDDADLDDLLHEENGEIPSTKNNTLEMTPLNLDHLTKATVDVNTGDGASPRRSKNYYSKNRDGFCALLEGSCTYLAHAHPRCCCTCTLFGIATLFFLLLSSIMNPTLYYGNVEHDFSGITSRFDLLQANIDHWCLRGDDDSCRCEDPLVPSPRGEFQTWTRAHAQNVKLLEEARTKSPIRVAFLGESTIEEMAGRWMGQSRGSQLAGMTKMFDQHFNGENGVEGIALGIAGDTSPNVLWRLLHGEMPTWFDPDIWWVALGMNDLGRMQCSEEVVVMGILRVVEEILEKRPNAQVVINSMLPMADLRGGIYPHMRDYKDSFQGTNSKASHYVKKPSPQKEDADKRYLKRNKEEDEEEEEGEDANNPEKLDKKTLKRYKRKDPVNPVLDPNETKMKKYQLFKMNRLPLWTSIYAINKALSKFCQKHDRVTFFDATSIFAERVERGKYMLKSSMISIRGHPSVAGYQAWEDKMLKKLQAMLAEQEKEKEIVKYEPKGSSSSEDDVGFGDAKTVGSSSSSSRNRDNDVKDSSSSVSSNDGRL